MVGRSLLKGTLSKCCRREHDPHDQISQLPDEIIASILSFLSLKEAAASSILSTRWVNMWKFTTRLNFDAYEALYRIAQDPSLSEKESAKYVEWVKKVLKVHKGSALEEFSIHFGLSNVYQQEIDQWLEFALARPIQRLQLNLLEDGYDTRVFEECYTFPVEIIAKSNDPCAFVGFKSLKELCLKSVNVTGEVVEYLLSNCLLEALVVEDSGLLVNLEVSGSSLMLRRLEIYHCYELKSIKIFNTNIISFKCLSHEECVLHDNPLLAEVDLGYGQLVTAVFREPPSLMSQLESLSLTVNAKTYLQIQEFPGLPKLKKLVISFYMKCDGSLLGFSSLIKASPYLQKFVLELVDLRPRKKGEINSRKRLERKKLPSCPHHHLKVVELRRYSRSTRELEVVIYFLENALALEELIIDPYQGPYINPFVHQSDVRLEREKAARNHAKQRISEIVPSRVKLSIL